MSETTHFYLNPLEAFQVVSDEARSIRGANRCAYAGVAHLEAAFHAAEDSRLHKITLVDNYIGGSALLSCVDPHEILHFESSIEGEGVKLPLSWGTFQDSADSAYDVLVLMVYSMHRGPYTQWRGGLMGGPYTQWKEGFYIARSKIDNQELLPIAVSRERNNTSLYTARTLTGEIAAGLCVQLQKGAEACRRSKLIHAAEARKPRPVKTLNVL